MADTDLADNRGDFQEDLEDEEDDSEEDLEDDEDDSEEYLDLEENQFREDLRQCLDECEHDGTFTSFNVYKSYRNPGLYLKDYGAVGLPLAPRDAEGIASICKQSPFGKGDQTLVDTSVRKTWELDATQFECQNPLWESFLDSLLKQTLGDLGVSARAEAQLYKLLLYEEGAFFKPHKDTEKVPGMFGTLVVCLPSSHTGGEVRLVHNGESRILETASESAHNMSTLGWYSDVSHEVRPVKSGFRLVLTYNLVQEQRAPKQSATALDRSHARLNRLLHRWNVRFPGLGRLLYPLEHQYTPASLSLSALKGRDAAIGQQIERVSGCNGIFWFLGRLTREIRVEDYWPEEKLPPYLLDHIVTPSGTDTKAWLQDVAEDDLLPGVDGLYGDDRRADSEDEEEFTGNESMPGNRRYYDTVLILIRKEVAVDQFLSSSDPSAFLPFFRLISDAHQANFNEESTKLMLRACKIILRKAIKALITAGNVGGLNECEGINVFSIVANHCHAINRRDLVREALQVAMQHRSWVNSIPLLKIIADRVEHEAHERGVEVAEVWSRWLSTPTPDAPTLSNVCDEQYDLATVRALLPQDASSFDIFDKWTVSRLETLLSKVQSCSISDLRHILDLARELPVRVYQEKILPILTTCPSQFGLMYILDQLYNSHVHPEITYRGVLNSFPNIAELSFRDIVSRAPLPQPVRPSVYDQTYHPPVPTIPTIVPTDSFMSVLRNAIKLNLHEEARTFLKIGLPNPPATDSESWRGWQNACKFVEELVTQLKDKDESYHQLIRPFIIGTLRGAADWLAPRRPVEPRDWSRKGHAPTGMQRMQRHKWDHCTQPACTELHQFLINPAQQVCMFTYNQSIRNHLEHSLDRTEYEFSTVEGGSPFTLIIKKTNGGYLLLKHKWDDDVRTLLSTVQRVRTDGGAIFGEEASKLDELESMLLAMQPAPRPVPRPVEPAIPPSTYVQPSQGPPALYTPRWMEPAHFPQTRRWLGPAPASVQNVQPPAGPEEHTSKKRKVDVIDLTEGAGN